MFKKRAMAAGRQLGKTDSIYMTTRWVDDLARFVPEKSMETGYVDNQPKWPYWVRLRNYSDDEWYKIGEWMLKTFGHSDWYRGDSRWVASNYKYWFRNEQDRTMFILRWT